MGLASAGGAYLLGASPVAAFGSTPMLAPLTALNTNRTLVLIQLEGGNDGLNTIVPIRNDIYYRRRPSLGVQPSQALPLTSDLGMHPVLTEWQSLFADGKMAVVQGVGYDNPDLSHFRSTDIWVSATDANEYDTSGWAGRYLEAVNPNFSDNPPDKPVAVQLGGASMIYRGRGSNMGMSFENAEVFEDLAGGGAVYNPTTVPATPYGLEMAYARRVANNSFRYAEALQDASQAGQNQVQYPEFELSENLSIVARLIKGDLGARIYMVSLGGFDTHSDQEYMHPQLLTELSASVTAFLADLDAGSRSDEVLVMTFSEFGRTLWENGSGGTDHATAAPLFLFGSSLEGGVFGSTPDLSNVNDNGDMQHETDFRSVYATVLRDWFELEDAAVATVLGGSFDSIPFLRAATGTQTDPGTVPVEFDLQGNYPNPLRTSTTITYTLREPGHVRLRLFDSEGRLVTTLVDGMTRAGRQDVFFDAAGLGSGIYIYRLETASGTASKALTVMR